MNREDFCFHHTEYGYTIFYKGISIGSSTGTRPQESRSWMNKRYWKEEAENTINEIIAGKLLKATIKKIDKNGGII